MNMKSVFNSNSLCIFTKCQLTCINRIERYFIVPKNEFKQEAYSMFEFMLDEIDAETIRILL